MNKNSMLEELFDIYCKTYRGKLLEMQDGKEEAERRGRYSVARRMMLIVLEHEQEDVREYWKVKMREARADLKADVLDEELEVKDEN